MLAVELRFGGRPCPGRARARRLIDDHRVGGAAKGDLNLLAVSGPANLAKGDGDAATWLPPNTSFRCDYAARQVGGVARARAGVLDPATAGPVASAGDRSAPHVDRPPRLRALPQPMTPAVRRALAVLSTCAVILVALAPAASADKLSEAKRKRREVQAQRAQVAAQVDMLKASNDEVQKALDAIQADVQGQQAAVAAARQAGAAATAEAQRARAAQKAAEERLATLRTSMRALAVAAYIDGPSRTLTVAFDAKSLDDVARRRQLYDVAAGKTTDLTDEMRAVNEDRALQRQAADDAERRAAQHKAEEEASLASLEQAQTLQQKAAADAETRLDQALAESDALAAVDQQLADEIQKEQAAIAARLAAARASAGRGVGPRRVGAVTVTTVRGITVNVSIAQQLDAMLAAAEADGFVFGGGGYRSSDSQIALRQAHCGTSDYAIYDMPPSQCHPPTARPGSSMHEQGLAIDFTLDGRAISSRGNPGYQWLAAHAASYGFYNLPSEPWHWSTTGN